MADNYTTPAGSGGNQYRSLDVASAGVHYPAVKISLGTVVDNFLTLGQAVMASSLPVVLASDHGDVKITLDSEAVVLGAGTAAFGKLAANSGVDIGDVDVLSLPALPAGSNTIGTVNIGTISTIATETTLAAVDTKLGTIDNLVLIEDAAHNSGDSGVLTLAVRTDSRATLVSATGDNSPLQVNSSGDLRVDNSAVTQPVSAASLPLPSGAATEATLASVKTAVELIDNAISGSEMQVDLVSIGGGATETTLASVKTAVELIDNAISGSEMQVDLVGIAGVATEATLATIDTSLNNIEAAVKTDGSAKATVALQVAGEDGTNTQTLKTDTDGHLQVDVLSGGGGGTQFAEDAGHNSGDLGTMALVVQQSADASLVGTDLDYAPLQVDATGYLKVNVKAGSAGGTEFNEDAIHSSGAAGTLSLGVRQDGDTSPVSATGDYHAMIFDSLGNLKVNIKAGAGSGGTAMTDDAAFTAGTTNITPAGAMFNDSTPDSVDEGDGGVLRMSANRNLYQTIRDAAGNERGVNVNASNQLSVTVDNTPTVTANAGTDLNTSALATSALQLADGHNVTVDNASGASAVNIQDGGNAITVDNGGTFAVQSTLQAGSAAFGKLSANSGIDIGDVDVTSIVPGTGATNLGKVEDALHSNGDVGVMALAVRRDANTTLSATDGDYVPLQVDALGKLKVEIFDGGDTLTVGLPSGAATEATLASVKTAVELIDNAISGSEMQVDLVGIAGVATETTLTDGNQKAQIVDASGDVMDIGEEGVTVNTTVFKGPVLMAEASISEITRANGAVAPLAVNTTGRLYCTTIGTMTADAGTDLNTSSLALEATLGSVKTAVELIDNAISGTEMQVDIVSALPAGTNAIGKLAANTGVDIGDVDVTSQPARVATTDTITAKLATDVIQDGTTALTPKFKIIDAATSGDNEIIALSGGKKLRVLAYTLVASAAVNAQFESSTGGNFITGSMNFAANGGVSAAFCPVGHFETVSGESLNLILSAAVSVDGHITYVEV